MRQYLAAIQHRDTFDLSQESPETIRVDIDVLNEEMEAAGAPFFAGGLESPGHAKSLRQESNGHTPGTDKGGFWILDSVNMDEAVASGRKAGVACRTPVEIRACLAMPSE